PTGSRIEQAVELDEHAVTPDYGVERSATRLPARRRVASLVADDVTRVVDCHGLAEDPQIDLFTILPQRRIPRLDAPGPTDYLSVIADGDRGTAEPESSEIADLAVLEDNDAAVQEASLADSIHRAGDLVVVVDADRCIPIGVACNESMHAAVPIQERVRQNVT